MPKKPASPSRRSAPGPDVRVSPLHALQERTAPDAWTPPSRFVAGCLGVAAILHAAGRERSALARGRFLDSAAEQVTSLLGPEEASRGGPLDRASSDSRLLPFFAAVNHLSEIERVPPAFMLHILDSLAALVPAESVEGGRVLSTRIMYGYDDVHNDLRTELAGQLVHLGFRLRNHELLCRGFAQLHSRRIVSGNLPQGEKECRRATRHGLADGDPRLVAATLNLRGVVAGMRGDMRQSIELLWEGLQLADHPALQVQFLANLGETLYRAGHFREARAARAAVIMRPHARKPISVGGYAACCAAFGDVDGVKWAAGQAILMASTAVPTRALAQGMMGCADACGDVGLTDLAKTLYERGRALADAHGFHDLQFRADPSQTRPRVKPPRAVAGVESTLESIAELAPNGVPTDAVLAW